MDEKSGSGRPVSSADWDARYTSGELPWDTGEPDERMIDVVRNHPVPQGAALEIGCGTGTNAVWLASEGFTVLGVDIAGTAIEAARRRSDEAAVRCDFVALDFLRDDVPGGPYDFAFDCGCFHVFDDAEERSTYAERVARLLTPEGLWLSIIGSTEGPERDHGPPRRSARDLVAAIEPVLEIIDLRSVLFHANIPTPARAWRCLARRRTER